MLNHFFRRKTDNFQLLQHKYNLLKKTISYNNNIVLVFLTTSHIETWLLENVAYWNGARLKKYVLNAKEKTANLQQR